MVNICREPEVCIGTALVCRYDKFSLVDLELYKAQARCLVALGIGGTKEQDIVLAVPLLAIDFLS